MQRLHEQIPAHFPRTRGKSFRDSGQRVGWPVKESEELRIVEHSEGENCNEGIESVNLDGLYKWGY